MRLRMCGYGALLMAMLLAGTCFGRQAAGIAPAPLEPSNYVLGAGDQITLTVADLDEISNKPVRLDMRGDIDLPIVGRVRAVGLTADQLAMDLQERLKKYLMHPDVSVAISEFRSQPVSILGAVAQPGMHQLEGHKTLFEMISMAGGLRQDAGNTITISRSLKWGPVPLPNAKNDSTGQYSVASVPVKIIMTGENPAENILIQPDDVISISKADIIYVVGSVRKPGGFELGQNENLSAMQVLSLAAGLDRDAAPHMARIMRVVPGSTSREEIPIDLKKLMQGKEPDLPMQANDILFVPNTSAKGVTSRTLEAVVQIATGLAIYGGAHF